MTIEEQKNYLHNLFKLEELRKSESNKNEVKKFSQAKKGNIISNYLINQAWDDDINRNTKVFLVKDKETGQIAFYFAINCGILFEELNIVRLKEGEISAFNRYVTATQRMKQKNMNNEEMESVNKEYEIALGELWEAVEDSDRVSFLLQQAEEKVQKKEEKSEALSDTDEEKHTQPVQETFPAIDIKFLCRNAEYKPKIELDFKLGVFVFWEIIVPHLLEISEKVGCKYIYLFAADNSENIADEKEEIIPWSQGYDPYEEEIEKESNVRSLVSYYINELKFKYVTNYKILKPHFERTCYTLVQEVDMLQNNREMVWQSHTPDEEMIN
ncbi:hypothetical protein [Eubacterium ventriosum]|uniref:hypothetical protein n=1 Tax=Eubacterium ventriosum TaxID=39496 RepID=UPI001C00ED97|nr:hypothetical protein [Eubacterium ventriosum]MBT9698801.1 hypothetical protein [Eubacterium ventriosum]